MRADGRHAIAALGRACAFVLAIALSRDGTTAPLPELETIAFEIPDGSATRWSLAAGVYADYGVALAADPLGGTVVMTSVESSQWIDLGGGSVATPGGDELLVSAYAPGGTFRWARRVFGPNVEQVPGALAVEPGGTILVGAASGDGSPPGFPLRYRGLTVLRLDAGGTILGATALDCIGAVRGLVPGASGSVFVVGDIRGPCDFGFGVAPFPLKAGSDLFLLRLDANLKPVWVRTIGGADASAVGLGVGVDSRGHVTIAGMTQEFSTSPVHADVERPLLVQFAPDGKLEWSTIVPGVAKGRALSLAIVGDDRLIVGGIVQGHPARDWDGFLSAFTSAGVHERTRRFGGDGAQNIRALAVTSDGQVVAGWEDRLAGGPALSSHRIDKLDVVWARRYPPTAGCCAGGEYSAVTALVARGDAIVATGTAYGTRFGTRTQLGGMFLLEMRR